MAMHQHDLRAPNGAKKNRKRLGRGDSSGNGSFSGKGMKGQKSRSGGGVRPGFEGWQLPLIKRLPQMRGFKNIFKRYFNLVNIDELNELYPEGGDVTLEGLVQLGVFSRNDRQLKILGRGELTVSLNVSAHKFSQSAKDKILAAGGKVLEI